jgi:hypothetical protein
MSVYEEDMIAVIGYTSSDDLPTINAVQDEYRGSNDVMVWVFGFKETPTENPPIILAIIVAIAIVAVVLVFGLRRRM